MDITAINGRFLVGMFMPGSGGKFAWDKEGGGLRLSGKRARPLNVVTSRNEFVEVVDDKTGEIVADGGDGDWFWVPEGDKPVTLRFKKLPDPKLSKAQIDKARQKTTVYVAHQEKHDGGPFCFGTSYQNGTLQKVIKSLLKIQASIPKEYRAKARCEIDSESGYEGSHYASIEVSYERPETDAEVIRRVQTDAERTRLTMRREKAELENLKRKYA